MEESLNGHSIEDINIVKYEVLFSTDNRNINRCLVCEDYFTIISTPS